jgi:hypothetical protein
MVVEGSEVVQRAGDSVLICARFALGKIAVDASACECRLNTPQMLE